MTYTQSVFKILDNGHIWLSKIGEVRMFMHRPVTGKIKTLTIKRDNVDDWFVTLTVDAVNNTDRTEVDETVQNSNFQPVNPTGIDLGLKALITTSDGKSIEPPKFLIKSEKRLKRSQRQLSRKRKGSGKRSKAKTRVQKVHRKIQRQRDDFAHKLSHDLAVNHDFIVFEDLNIRGMQHNHSLAKIIADAGWNKIVQYTAYKAESAGRIVMLIDPKQTSQECSQCGNIKHDLNLPDRIYHCSFCGLIIDRDLNASINIKRRGMQKLKETIYM